MVQFLCWTLSHFLSAILVAIVCTDAEETLLFTVPF